MLREAPLPPANAQVDLSGTDAGRVPGKQ